MKNIYGRIAEVGEQKIVGVIWDNIRGEEKRRSLAKEVRRSKRKKGKRKKETKKKRKESKEREDEGERNE